MAYRPIETVNGTCFYETNLEAHEYLRNALSTYQ